MAARILIVEDEETLRESLTRVLIKEGYTVNCVDSSESALRTIELCAYDMVISDVILPGLSGLELLRKCKLGNPDLIIIIITAYATIENAVEAVKAGAFDYLVKPITHDNLRAVIRNALQKKPSL
jgi:DNA-binding NtrC family response regulator